MSRPKKTAQPKVTLRNQEGTDGNNEQNEGGPPVRLAGESLQDWYKRVDQYDLEQSAAAEAAARESRRLLNEAVAQHSSVGSADNHR